MSISTRKGDAGSTDLLFGQRVLKSHPRVIALGDVDELNAALGLVRLHAQKPETKAVAEQVQQWLIGLMGQLATPVGGEERYEETHSQRIATEQVSYLDGWVEKLEREGQFKFTGWVLPGAAGSPGGAFADAARTICRRAERAIIALDSTGDELESEEPLRFLNRLSDVLWLLARWEEKPQR
jgi:cob(I)alamin adenosyltransferase